jgi:hypothetical protein
MPSYVPKVTYTHIITGESHTFTFDSQPEKDPFNEKTTPMVKESRSSNGTRQVQFNYILKSYKLKFLYQSKTVYDAWYAFITEHALKGGSFNYYPSNEVDEYDTWELDIAAFDTSRPLFDSTNTDFLYSFSFAIERVLDSNVDLDTGEAGVGAISETSFTIVNNQTSAADVTGLLFDGSLVEAARIEYSIYRNTTGVGAVELAETGEIRLAYSPVAETWDMQRVAIGDAGVTLTVTTLGQIQYTSSNLTGSPSASVMRFRARTLSQG